jgi:hypothetical protein
MQKHSNKLEEIAMSYLNDADKKPEFTNREFMNTLIIFQTALMDKLYDIMEYDKMSIEHRYKMAESCGNELRKLIHTYTNLDTREVENFL